MGIIFYDMQLYNGVSDDTSQQAAKKVTCEKHRIQSYAQPNILGAAASNARHGLH